MFAVIFKIKDRKRNEIKLTLKAFKYVQLFTLTCKQMNFLPGNANFCTLIDIKANRLNRDTY